MVSNCFLEEYSISQSDSRKGCATADVDNTKAKTANNNLKITLSR